MRHGESFANRNGVIVSSPDVGLNQYPLTGQGVSSVAEKAVSSRFDSQIKIIHSDFLRTTQTAQIVAEVVDCHQIQPSEALRERYFGEFDGLSDEHYSSVWQMDKQGVIKHDVESIASVLQRMLSCVWELEKEHQNRTILIVSHGDCLQILLSWFQGLRPSLHRQIPTMKPAAIRSLNNQQSLQNILNQLNIEFDAAA